MYDVQMRTTLDIPDDVLLAAKSLAAQKKQTTGRVVGDLLRQAMRSSAGEVGARNGVPVFASKKSGVDSAPPTLDLVNRLRDGGA